MTLNFNPLLKSDKDNYDTQLEIEDGILQAIYYNHIGGSFETAFTVPGGKKFFLSKIWFVNEAGSSITVVAKVGGEVIFRRPVLSGTTEFFNFETPLVIGSATDIDVISDSLAFTNMIGWLV